MRFLISLTLLLALTAHAEEERISTPYKKPAKKATAKKAEPAKDEPAPAAAEPEKKEESTWDKVKEKASEGAEMAAEGAQKAQKSLAAARERRAESKWTITGNYQFFETWVLTKYGFTIGYNRSESSTFELEYMRGSLGLGYLGIDIASITEQRLALLWRSYGSRNSFNFITGVNYYDLEAGYGSEYLATVAGGYTESIRVRSLGVTWGLGNRWQTKKGFVWGFDWFTIHVPLVILEEKNDFVNQTTDPEQRKDAEDAMDFFKRFPTFGVVKAQLGFSW